MLWFTGSILFVVWLVAKFAFHKGGMIHIILIAALSFFFVQFVQDWRTREYRRSLGQ